MKQFRTFITEARVTKASSQAKRLGLVGDGHGDWYDRQGSLKAKTVKGELKMFGARGGAEDEKHDSDRSTSAVTSAGKNAGPSLASKSRAIEPTLPDAKETQASNGDTKAALDQMSRDTPLTIAFDKFDSPETSDNILATVEEVSGGEFYYIFPSRDSNIEELKNAYPEISESIIDDKNAETIFDVLQSLNENGFDAINIVVRSSRAKEISELALQQNGTLYTYVMMNVIPVDERSIREQYLAGDIFKVGSVIESNNRTGQVFRRGANHLICMDENKDIFRAWVSQAKEVDKFFLALDF